MDNRTPLTPEEEAWYRSFVTGPESRDDNTRVAIRRLLATLDRERRERVDPDLRARIEAAFTAVRRRHTDTDPGFDGSDAPIGDALNDAETTVLAIAATEAPRERHEHVPMDRPLRGDSDYGIGGDFCRVCGERMPTPATPDHTVVGEERGVGGSRPYIDFDPADAATPDHTVVGEERDIDVERLARAAANESDSATEDERRNGDLWSLLSERIRDDWRRKAHRIAAEYRATPRPR